MMDLDKRFDGIRERWVQEEGVVEGNMMRAPALKSNDKVFVFFHKERMGFRLGPTFDPKEFGLVDWGPLSPFKTKPPLKGWFMVGGEDADAWEELTGYALEFTRSL